ncbi:MAG: DNA-binding NtrC family response regulator [Verrucomicrobiales bacterium]|jgi:DNA-binding NtrC family response regulator
MQSILIVDTESDFLEWAEKYLTNDQVTVTTATSGEDALRLYQENPPDLVIAEYHLAPVSGLDILKRIRQADPNALIILTTGFPPTNAVIEAMKLGAYDFLRKEALPYDLRPIVESALQTRDEMNTPPVGDVQTPGFDLREQSMIGRSPAMQEVFKLVGRVSRSDATVMVTGENGSGKEIVARAIHKFSPRANRDFVAINCAAIPDNLLESELFGHEKGSFTGALAQRVGRFEQCDGGTLFMDEIGDMPLQVQSKILRVLQEGEFSRVGGNQTLKTDVRILAATNKKLEQEVEAGTFREDLFYRLNVIRIHIPPLRDRREDIRLLADFFLEQIATKKGAPKLRLSEEALCHLEQYYWPGNVRELENTMKRACVLATTDVLLPKDIPLQQLNQRGQDSATAEKPLAAPPTLPTATDANSQAPTASGPVSVDQAVQTLIEAAEKDPSMQLLPWIEREMTRHAIDRTNGNQVQAAKLLGITRATLRKRLERLDAAVATPAESQESANPANMGDVTGGSGGIRASESR